MLKPSIYPPLLIANNEFVMKAVGSHDFEKKQTRNKHQHEKLHNCT